MEWVGHHSLIKDPGLLIFHTALFRHFNWPATAQVIGLRARWNPEKVLAALAAMKEAKQQMYTGAYMVTGQSNPKYLAGVEALTRIWKEKKFLGHAIKRENSIEAATKYMSTYRCFGMFVGYEIATDLTYFPLLANAMDKGTWANPGPGAVRGLNRIYNRPLNERLPIAEAIDEMVALHKKLTKIWKGERLSLREIEHSLCEFDKYRRIEKGEGRTKSKYDGKG